MFRKLVIISFVLCSVIINNIPFNIAQSEEQPKFPENYYTYKSLYNSAKNFDLMAVDLKTQLAEAEQERVWGLKDPPTPWASPSIENSHYIFQRSGSKMERALLDLNNDKIPDYVVTEDITGEENTEGWTVFFNNGNGFGYPVIIEIVDNDDLLDENPPISMTTRSGESRYTKTRTFDVNTDLVI